MGYITFLVLTLHYVWIKFVTYCDCLCFLLFLCGFVVLLNEKFKFDIKYLWHRRLLGLSLDISI